MTDITVVVPSYNRPERLQGCLQALMAQREAGQYEVVVVDDGSATPLAPVCAEFGPLVRCLRQTNAGPAAARNAGAAAAHGRFLAFTDDDCRPQPLWLASLLAAQENRPERLVGGRVVNGLRDNPYAESSQMLCDYLYEYFGASSDGMPFFTSNNMGCNAASFAEIGGFDETFPLAAAEDRDFGLRWGEAGGSLTYAPDAVVDHFHALTMPRYWRQHANYGRGARHLHRRLDSRHSDRPKREPLQFYMGLVLHPLRRLGMRGLSQSALMALSQIAMVRGYASERRAGG
ncbi:glycosyltransferase [Palleronia sp.]|uniref:glycosyltransferase n=1 Tax=Palleronia sp. TaxID=1940284 RepID=UPI0035C7CA01